jgi:hypothetical protein
MPEEMLKIRLFNFPRIIRIKIINTDHLIVL